MGLSLTLRAIASIDVKFFPFCISKIYFFYFILSFLQNTRISLSIIHIYLNKILISLTQSSLSQTQHNPHSHHHQATTIIKIDASNLPLGNKINTSMQQKRKRKRKLIKKTPKHKLITPESTQPINPQPQSPIPPTHTHNHYHDSLKLNQKTRKTNPTHPPRLSLTSKSKYAKPFNSLQLNRNAMFPNGFHKFRPPHTLVVRYSASFGTGRVSFLNEKPNDQPHSTRK